MVLVGRAVTHATHIVTSRGAPYRRNCRETMPAVVKGRGAPDMLPTITKQWEFKCGKVNSTTVKHVYSEFADFVESYYFNFATNGPLVEILPVILMEGMLALVSLRYTRDYLTPGVY